MKILFHLPYPMFERCFLKKQVDSLRPDFEVILPQENESMESLLERYSRNCGTCDIMVTGWDTPDLTSDQIAAASKLRLLVHSAGSVRRLLPESFWDRSIRLATMNDALAIGVAETTLGMILCGLKNFFGAREWTKQGNWSTMTYGEGRPSTRETFGMTVGIVSASRVGRHLIRLLSNFDVRVLVFDPFLSEEEANTLGVTKVSLPELARQSEVVTLHAPVLPSTRHLLGADFFAAMQDNAIFINTARGVIVDEAALLKELQTSRFTAFIDVTDPEPPAPDHPFRNMPNVILTHHIAGAVTNGCYRQGAETIRHIRCFAEGKPLPNEITKEQFAHMA